MWEVVSCRRRCSGLAITSGMHTCSFSSCLGAPMPARVRKQCPALCSVCNAREVSLDFDSGRWIRNSEAGLCGAARRRTYLFFRRTSWKFPIYVCDFPILLRRPLFFYYYYCYYYLYHCLPVRSGSGSGNRSVTCHYWCNSVIRHREPAVCSTLYGGTAGVAVHWAGDSIWHAHARTHRQEGRPGLEQTGRLVCLCVCIHIFVCVKEWERVEADWIFLFSWPCQCVCVCICSGDIKKKEC